MNKLIPLFLILILVSSVSTVWAFEPNSLDKQMKKIKEKKKPILKDEKINRERQTKQFIPKPIITQKQELITIYKQDQRNYWNENYDISVKVFDKRTNPNPNFDDFQGLIKDSNVSILLQDPRGKIYPIQMKNDYGVWSGSQYFVENLSIPGKYLVRISAQYQGLESSQNTESFLFGVTSNRVTVTNSTQ